MTAPTDQAIASWKGRRTTAVQNVQAVITRVDTETLDENNQTLVDLEGLLTDLEVKFSTYEKAHDKIVGQATPDQLNREEYGNTISLEHEQLLGYLEDAEATVRNAIKTLKRRQDTLEKENVRQQRVQLLPSSAAAGYRSNFCLLNILICVAFLLCSTSDIVFH